MGGFKSPLVAMAILTAPLASAHMFLATPIRFAQPAASNGPLLADGSNWPCQSTGGPYVAGAQVNIYPLGSRQPLSFIGQATHGGGSCQISITYDTAPTKHSVWKVIKSIEGGCPAQNQTGNMGDDANAPDPYTYTFDVPADIPAGNATVQWTWMNKVGNREMYGQCAPVVLTGSGGPKANYDALPDVFTANIGGGCDTLPDMDVLYPNPGLNLERLNGATSAFASATGAGCQKPSVSGSAVAAAAQPSASGASKASSAAGGFVTVASGTKATAVVKLTSAAQVSSAPAATTAASATGSSSGSGTALSGPCSAEGEYNCVAGTGFQQCASGMWSALMAVAPGTKCSGGLGSSLNIVAARAVPFVG